MSDGEDLRARFDIPSINTTKYASLTGIADNDTKSTPKIGHMSRSYSRKLEQRQTYGLNTYQLKKWQQMRQEKLLAQESAMQEIAVAKVRGFLDAIGKEALLAA